MFFSAQATLVLLFSFASFTMADPADPPGLTGTAPGSNPADVRYKAANDPSYIDDTNFQMSMINTHNKWRREHGVADVSWDPRLAAFAATVCRKCEWKHSGGPYGENLSAGFETAQLSIDAWGDEREFYRSSGDYDKPSPPPGSGHFTQLVWATSRTIGCARIKCAGIIGRSFESWFVVCEYLAPGNVVGYYTRNVFKPIGNPGGQPGAQDG